MPRVALCVDQLEELAERDDAPARREPVERLAGLEPGRRDVAELDVGDLARGRGPRPGGGPPRRGGGDRRRAGGRSSDGPPARAAREPARPCSAGRPGTAARGRGGRRASAARSPSSRTPAAAWPRSPVPRSAGLITTGAPSARAQRHDSATASRIRRRSAPSLNIHPSWPPTHATGSPFARTRSITFSADWPASAARAKSIRRSSTADQPAARAARSASTSGVVSSVQVWSARRSARGTGRGQTGLNGLPGAGRPPDSRRGAARPSRARRSSRWRCSAC